MENGLPPDTRRVYAHLEVSRALWPTASTTCRLAMRSPLASTTRAPVRLSGPFSSRCPPRGSERNSPPSASMLWRNRLHHADQPESADVRLAHVEDSSGAPAFTTRRALCARRISVLDLAVQLPSKTSRAALAELHVRFRVELALPPQAEGILCSFTHRLAALQNDGRKPSAQDQPGEDAHARCRLRWALRQLCRACATKW